MLDWRYRVKYFSSAQHRCGRYGVLVGESSHRTRGSMLIEVDIQRGKPDIAYVDIIDLSAGAVQRQYSRCRE